VNELSSYVFSLLREGDISLYRGSSNGLAPILLVAAEETSPATTVARGRSHGHRSEHSHWTHDVPGRLGERRHGCRSDGVLTASTRDDGLTGSHLQDRRGHVAMGAAAAERARGRRR
jgi:hypothetical protein